jgi:hypothetical protein
VHFAGNPGRDPTQALHLNGGARRLPGRAESPWFRLLGVIPIAEAGPGEHHGGLAGAQARGCRIGRAR